MIRHKMHDSAYPSAFCNDGWIFMGVDSEILNPLPNLFLEGVPLV
jgi:hypothetical protein